MALSGPRWFALALVGCALVAAAYLPPHDAPLALLGGFRYSRPPDDQRTPETRRRDRVARAANQAFIALTSIERRHALLAGTRARTRPRAAPPLIYTDSPIPPSDRRGIERRVAELWDGVQPVSPDVGVAIGLFSRIPSSSLPLTVTWREVAVYVPPAAADGRNCLILVPFHQGRRARLQWLQQEMGLCAFYAAFGPPGPSVERWLAGRDYIWAAQGGFGASPKFVQPLAVMIEDSRHLGFVLMFDVSADGLACTGGDLARCRAALLGRGRADRRDGGRADGAPTSFVRRSGARRGGFGGWGDTFGGHDGAFLADLVREHGRERFARFWTSRQSVDTAFRAAFDVSIEEWTRDWARVRLGQHTAGARPPLSAIVTTVLVTGLAAAGAAFYATRRQVA